MEAGCPPDERIEPCVPRVSGWGGWMDGWMGWRWGGDGVAMGAGAECAGWVIAVG